MRQLPAFLVACRFVGVGFAAPPAVTRLPPERSSKQHLQRSPDGKRLLMTRIHQGKMALWTINADGSDMKRLMPNLDTPHFDGHWSPDGKTILYVHDILQGTDGKLHLYRVNADGSDSKVVIPNTAFEESPRWRPDGKSFLFLSTRDGNQEIYHANADGKNIRRLTSEVAADNNPSWSPDGKRIVFASGRSGNLDIWTMDADGKDLKRLTNHPGMDFWPVWSPDGKRIAFTSNRDGNYEIYLMNTDEIGRASCRARAVS